MSKASDLLSMLEASNWDKVDTAKISYRGSRDCPAFTGTATLYEYSETGKGKPKYGVTYAIKVKEGKAKEVILTNKGAIADVVKKAFGIKGRVGGAKSLYKDWGSPIGKPADNVGLKQGKGTMILF